MSDGELLIVFTLDGRPLSQIHCHVVPEIGDMVDVGDGAKWEVARRVWTPLSEADTDVIVELDSYAHAQRLRSVQ